MAACATGRSEWKARYEQDLGAARTIIQSDHPGPADRAHPAFATILDDAYHQASASADEIKSERAYQYYLQRFINRFQDGHLALSFEEPFEPVSEAGIHLAYRSGSFFVESTDARYDGSGQPPLGARLVSCDGRPARDTFEERVLAWKGRPFVEADWYRLAPELLLDYGPPAPTALERCTFVHEGRSFDVSLVWHPAGATAAADEPMRRRPLALHRLDGGATLWVDVPTFNTPDDSSIASMHALVAALEAEMERTTSWKVLVFDLRGNNGGSSTWGDRLATAVFGAQWLAQAQAWLNDGVYVQWRASVDNLHALGDLQDVVARRHGANSPLIQQFQSLAASMTTALADSASFIGSPARRAGVPLPTPVEVPGPVILLTSASCFSACLDFVDRMRLHPAVVQVGQPTGVDTIYMENWSQKLPSGHARISYPMKVYRNRRRGNNEAYVPDVPYPGKIEDTQAVRAWIEAHYRDWPPR